MSEVYLDDRFKGVMLGLAIGDAFGYPIELMDYESICERFEKKGCLDLAVSQKTGTALFTDDTQLSLFTADGLLWAHSAGADDGRANYEDYIFLAYQVWLYTQTKTVAGKEYAWLFDSNENPYKLRLLKAKGLYKKRTADTKNIDALLKIRNMEYGTPENPKNENKDNGAVKRVAPIGLYFYSDTKKAFDMGCRAAAITHGSPVGYIAAGCYAALIAEIVSGAEIEDAVHTVIDLLNGVKDGEILKKTLQYALELVGNEGIEPRAAVSKMGYGFEAYEVLAIAVYCAVLHNEAPRYAIQLAANHDGASDTCASMTAAIMGAYYGDAGFPKGWADRLQYRNLISSMAEKLLKAVCASDDFNVDDGEDE